MAIFCYTCNKVAEFEDSATMARWALMYSEAMVANNLAAPADTIVDIAVDYYGSHSDYERLKLHLLHIVRCQLQQLIAALHRPAINKYYGSAPPYHRHLSVCRTISLSRTSLPASVCRHIPMRK